MERLKAIATMTKFGDFIVEYTNSVGKPKYFVGTTDFTTEYISKRKQPIHSTTGILTFSWDANKFKFVDPRTIKRITPLSKILRNAPSVVDFANAS